MGVFSRALGFVRGKLSHGPVDRARREEALGNLEAATALYVEGSAYEEAARVFVLRAEIAGDSRDRLRLMTQAATASARVAGDEARERTRQLRVRRSRLALDLGKARELRLTPSELIEIGKALESANEPALAAEAYSLAGDVEAQTRSLVAAGAIARLEEVLDREQNQARAALQREQLAQRVGDLVLAGKRRQAVSLCADSTEEALVAIARTVTSTRVVGSSATLLVDGDEREFAFGDEVTLGRSDATVTVASPAVSRAHLRVRRANGGYELLDLGSSNGTTLGGARLDVPVQVGEGVEVKLGGEVPVSLEPHPEGGLDILVAGRRVHAPFGPFEVAGWRFAPADDEWLEVVDSAGRGLVLGQLRVDDRAQLCRGDELRELPAGPVRVKVP